LGNRNTPKFVGAAAVGKIAQELKDAEPKGQFVFPDELKAAVSDQRLSGKCFLISDFLFPLEEVFSALTFLRSRNFDVSVLQVLAKEELNLSYASEDILVDSETGERVQLSLNRAAVKAYNRSMDRHIRMIKQQCNKSGIVHALVNSEEQVEEVILKKLPMLGLLN
jgi:hypothetical protein